MTKATLTKGSIELGSGLQFPRVSSSSHGGKQRSLPLIMTKGYCAQVSWLLVYTCFEINIDFLPFVCVPK